MSLLPTYQKNGTQTREDIIHLLQNGQLLKGLTLLRENKSTFYIWKNYPFIPDFQERYFWDVICQLFELEKKRYLVFQFSDDKYVIFNPNIVNFQCYIWSMFHTQLWIPEEFMEKHPIISRLLKTIPFVLATGNELNTEKVNRYLLRQYLHAKLSEKSIALVENPYAIRRLLKLETKYAKEYQRMLKKDNLEEFERLKTVAVMAWENIFSQDICENNDFKIWLKKHPAKPYRVNIQNAFPKESRKDYPYTIPMFEKMLEDLRKNK